MSINYQQANWWCLSVDHKSPMATYIEIGTREGSQWQVGKANIGCAANTQLISAKQWLAKHASVLPLVLKSYVDHNKTDTIFQWGTGQWKNKHTFHMFEIFYSIFF